MTETELKNASLALIGAQTVSDYDTSTSREAVLINALFPAFKLKSLELRRWNFASKRLKVVSTTPLTDDEYQYEFDLPADLVNLQAIFSDSSYLSTYYKFNFSNGKIYANVDTIYIKYTFDADVDVWNGSFTNFMIYALAAEICYNLTGQQVLKDRLEQDAYGPVSSNRNGGKLGEASRVNGQQNVARVIQDSPILAARSNGL